MTRIYKGWCIIGVCAALVFFTALIGSANELIIPELEGEPGQIVTAPIILDQVDNLAGIKLSLKYDAGLIKYKKSEKGKSTSSFLHVVNDKKPGALIIVMASATGIKGKNLTLVTLDFEINASIKAKTAAKLDVIELQLMSDKLEDLKYDIKSNPIRINVKSVQPEKKPAAKPDDPPNAPKPDIK